LTALLGSDEISHENSIEQTDILDAYGRRKLMQNHELFWAEEY
jgi:hypothetical protein